MSLAPGARLGTYEIVALIGAGGMGEVYRARDGQLTRDVAIKILPSLFARDPERLARFTREANLLASLNHPNIAAIYGFESSDPGPGIVLELVEGPTLADRLERGPIPLEEALPIARQVAEALEAAHAQGIVHRDLKPGNIKVREDGAVKVLDFGLAKAIAADSSSAAVAASPTITSPAMTALGTIMGTAAYMSPEQARGRAVDKRSDIWAFGAVLYEMLTGRRAFDGEDVSDTLANILKQDPDWSALPGDTPLSVARVLRRCLTKDPRQRTHDIADVRIDLEERAGVDATAPPIGPGTRVQPLRAFERAAWLAAALALATVAGLGWWRGRAPEPVPQQVIRFPVRPPAGYSFGALGSGGGFAADLIPTHALSPDGTRLVFYASDRTGKGTLFLRALDSFEPRQLPQTDGGGQPFWSPDSRFIAFFADRRLYKLDLARGERSEICAVTGNPRGGTWGAAGTIIYTTTNPPATLSVPAEGGTPTKMSVTSAGADFVIASWPLFLPDGRQFLFSAPSGNGPEGAIFIAEVGSQGASRELIATDTQAVYLEPGYLLFGRNARLFRVAFNAQTGKVSGDAVPVVEQLRALNPLRFGEFSASRNGTLSYRSGVDTSNQFTWVTRTGTPQGTVGPPGRYRTPALSPDRRRLVYTDIGDGNLKIMDLQRDVRTTLTSEAGVETAPVWSSDGKYVYYRSDNGGMFSKEVDSIQAPVKIFDERVGGPQQFLKHPTLGPLLLFFQGSPRRPSMDVLSLKLTDKSLGVLVETQYADVEPQISPDGKWLAYASGDPYQIWMEPFPQTGQRFQVSQQGGRQPMWRDDSRELFFVNDNRQLFAVQVPASGSWNDAKPDFLFEMHANVTNTRNSYVPSADGQRFLINMVRDAEDAPISVISNWLAGVK
jgi:Tol biopolymer transport system component